MSTPFKLKYKNVEKIEKKLNLKFNPSKKSKFKTGSFVEGSGGKGGHKFMAGGEIGYQGKDYHISLKPTILSESSKHHSFIKPDFKISASFSPSEFVKKFKKKG